MTVTVRSGAAGRAGRNALLLGAATALALSVWLVTPLRSQDADPVVARVNGTEIRQSMLNLAEEDLGQNAQQMSPEAKQDYLVSYVSDVLLVAKAAEGRNVADGKEFKERMSFIRNKLLMETLLKTEGRSAVTDDAMRKVYDEAVKQMGDESEVRARHILVQTEEEAKAILADLKKGGNFETIAKEKSKDPGAAAQGGDLGYFTKDQMVAEFAEVAFKLDKGALSDPVKTQFGWHIIRVEDKRTKPAPAFDQVKEQVETYVIRKAQADYVTQLRKDAKIERLDKPAAKPGDKPGDKPAEKPADKK